MMSILFGASLGLSLMLTAIFSYKRGYSDAMDDFINISSTIERYVKDSQTGVGKPDVLKRTDLN